MGNNKLLKHVKACTGWNNHLVLMYLALRDTQGKVVEFGMGDGSTRQLDEYCQSTNRKMVSYDTDPSWLNRFIDLKSELHEINLINPNQWDMAAENSKDASVVLIDHSPGEDRRFRLQQLKDINGIIVCHDAQPKPNAGDYQFETMFSLFKYRVRYQPEFDSIHNDFPTGAMAFSNTHNLNEWVGNEFNGLKITNG